MATATVEVKQPQPREFKASVYCPLCTHTVPGTVEVTGKSIRVTPGQKCPRCHSSLDAGYVLRLEKAA